MNDIEDLVRQELRVRVAAAEAAAPDEQPVALLADLDRRIRRARLSRRWAASGLSAVAVLAAVALPLTLASPGQPPTKSQNAVAEAPVPLTDTAATPRGWAPVAYGDAQISAPASWYVEGPASAVCGGGARGMVFVGAVPTERHFREMGCGLTASVAAIEAAPRRVAVRRPATSVNGIGVVPISGAHGYRGYLVPSLHVRMMARGPLAIRVLATLTRSPLSVVLAGGRPLTVPHTWSWRDFGGLRFAVPASWRIEHDALWGGCSIGIAASTVRLSAASKFAAYGCPLVQPDVGMLAARPGIVVGTGRFAVQNARDGQKVSCALQHGMRICILRPGRGSAVLTLLVYPHRAGRPVLVEIGLAGNGMTARTIYESIRPG